MGLWGGSSATNTIDNAVSAMINVANDTGQSCQPISQQVQQLDLVACGNITIDDSSMSQTTTMDVNCVQQAAQNAYSKASLDQKAQQMAKSLTSGLSLLPTSSEATNIMRLSMSVAESVHNSAQQLIASATNQAQNVTAAAKCNASGTGGNIDVENFQMTQFSTSVVKGLQQSKQVASAVADLKQAAAQTASATHKGIFDFGSLSVIGAVIAIAVMAPLLRPAHSKVGRAAKLALVAGLLGLAVFAYMEVKGSGGSPLGLAKSVAHI
jgi:hypothetical protein